MSNSTKLNVSRIFHNSLRAYFAPLVGAYNAFRRESHLTHEVKTYSLNVANVDACSELVHVKVSLYSTRAATNSSIITSNTLGNMNVWKLVGNPTTSTDPKSFTKTVIRESLVTL